MLRQECTGVAKDCTGVGSECTGATTDCIGVGSECTGVATECTCFSSESLVLAGVHTCWPESAIVPELQSHDVNSFPFLKAAALRFLTKFWFKIPAMDLVGDVVRFLLSDANVVHSYAAIFIKKRLLLRDKMAEPSFTLILPVLSQNLFDALKKHGSEENRYVMHCIMHIGAIPKSPCIIGRCTTSVIIRFCENLRHPGRLFEAFDYLVTQSDKDWIPLVPALDIWILPSVRMIVDKHAMRFFPYALRLLARLMDYDTYKVPPHYKRSIRDILTMLMVEVLSV
ncbi:hypothetical protein OSB04_032068 [Centaurea solstitialis]|uniref:Uncharacterized protein n=1 Tax=Centaurea solstitialis TaxID=347529 RepID=A0AA38SNC3_9ASTR|nr:hypothetical protein OSB04_032068 [Centaurea solstitialis]